MNKLSTTYFLPASFLLVACLLGGWLRFASLGAAPYWMDEGYTINAVQAIAERGLAADGTAILDSGGRYFCPLYCYPTALLTNHWGDEAATYRFLAVIFGCLAIILAYAFAQRLFASRAIGMLSSALVALSYWQIAWSREARWYTMLEVFFWLALLAFYIFLTSQARRQKIIAFIVAALATVLAIATHKIAYALPLIMLLWYLIENRGLRRKQLWIPLVLLGLIALAEYGLGLHFIEHALTHVSFHYNLPYYLSFYLRSYWPLILLGTYGYFSADSVNRRRILLSISPFVIYLLALSFLSDVVHYRYLFQATLGLYVVAAYGALKAYKSITPRLGKIAFVLIALAAFFGSGHGIVWPKAFYLLEADDPTRLNRPYYAYTPQPNWNAAYGYITKNLQPDDIVISSHPHFNKIFLKNPGYWIYYNYLGMEDTNKTVRDNKEYYVGAEIVNNLSELQTLTASRHGYIIFDFMSADGKIKPGIVEYIRSLTPVFSEETNPYSVVWVYRF